MRHLDVELDDEDVEHAGEDLHALDQLHLLLQAQLAPGLLHRGQAAQRSGVHAEQDLGRGSVSRAGNKPSRSFTITEGFFLLKASTRIDILKNLLRR